MNIGPTQRTSSRSSLSRSVQEHVLDQGMAPQHLSNCFWAAANLQEEPPLIDVIFLLEAMLSPEALLLGPETREDFNAAQP